MLLDLKFGDGSQSRDNIRRLRESGARVLIFTDPGSDALMREAISAGALGIVLKDQDVASVAAAVQVVNDGQLAVSAELAAVLRSSERARPRLSERERQVLELYAVGLPAKSVARRLGVQIGTTKVYLSGSGRSTPRSTAGPAPGWSSTSAIEDGLVDPPTGRSRPDA